VTLKRKEKEEEEGREEQRRILESMLPAVQSTRHSTHHGQFNASVVVTAEVKKGSTREKPAAAIAAV